MKLIIGGTTQILTTLKKIQPITNMIKNSGWKKEYEKKIEPKK